MTHEHEASTGQLNATSDAPFIYDPLFVFGVECAVNVFRAMMDDVGPIRTLEAIKPYTRNWAKRFIGVASLRFGLQGNDFESAVLPSYYTYCATSFWHITPLEIREGGATFEALTCPVAQLKAPPEICIAWSHYLQEGMAEENPGYSYAFTDHLADGDKSCRYVMWKKGGKYNLENLGALEKTMPLELTMEETGMLSGLVTFEGLNIFASAGIDLLGSERFLELTVPTERKTGLKLGAMLKANANGKSDLLTVGRSLEFLAANAMWQKGASVGANDSVAEREIFDCPCKGMAPETCKQFEGVFDGICKAFDPSYEFAYDRMMTKGDKTCHWTIRKKGELAKETPKEEGLSDDPVKTLTMRFARGEITREEYEEKMAIIKKHYIG